MSLSYKDSTRNTRLDALTTALGTVAFLEIFTGSAPGKSAGTFAADTGTKLASLACANPTVIIEGDAGVGSGSLNFSSTIASGGTVSITSATITEGNA